MNYYNEFDPNAAAWLRALIAAGHIPPGDVDERSITEIQPHELTPYTQCHFFAGIGGWPLALALAGWPPSGPVWTGSCPCQPFSGAGQGKGASDARHLWPIFHRLISQQRPQFVFGEQVAQAIGFNWLDGVSADLEADGYAVGATVLGAHSVGAPHIRQRLYWVADATSRQNQPTNPLGLYPESGRGSTHSGMGNTHDSRPQGHGQSIKLDDAERWESAQRHGATPSLPMRMGDTSGTRRREGELTTSPTGHGSATQSDGSISHFWERYEIVHCRDGKARRFESGSFPLAHGLPGRVGLLRGYGNAIVPQVAAHFIQAFQEVKS